MAWVRLTPTEIHIYRLLGRPRRYHAGRLTYRLVVSGFSPRGLVRVLWLDSTSRATPAYGLDLKSVARRSVLYDAIRRMGYAAADEADEKKPEESKAQVRPIRWQRSLHAASLPVMTGMQRAVSSAVWITVAGMLGTVTIALGVVQGLVEDLTLVLAVLSIPGALVLVMAACKDIQLFSFLRWAPRRAEILQTLDLEQGVQANAHSWSDDDINHISLNYPVGSAMTEQLNDGYLPLLHIHVKGWRRAVLFLLPYERDTILMLDAMLWHRFVSVPGLYRAHIPR